MRHKPGVVAAAVALTLAAGCSGGEETPARTPPPDARRVDVARASTLTGRVTLDGPVPQNPPIKMAGDPVCQRAHTDGATVETYVSENGGLGNVFVYVKDGLGNYYFDTPAEPVKLDQSGCQYVPHVFGLQAGQAIEFVNSDATIHNVHALGKINPEFNFSQMIQNQTDTRSLRKPEVMVRFKCDVHGWMSAYAGVLEHPYFAVTAPSGSFELKNLPAGTYTIEAWHEALGTRTQSVTLTDNDKKEVSVTFKP